MHNYCTVKISTAVKTTRANNEYRVLKSAIKRRSFFKWQSYGSQVKGERGDEGISESHGDTFAIRFSNCVSQFRDEIRLKIFRLAEQSIGGCTLPPLDEATMETLLILYNEGWRRVQVHEGTNFPQLLRSSLVWSILQPLGCHICNNRRKLTLHFTLYCLGFECLIGVNKRGELL